MHHSDFLCAIRDRPDDDALRLVFADWLSARGDPRGEFIQVQMQQSGEAFGSDRWRELAWRAADLLAEHRDVWLGPLLDVPYDELEFRRGLIHSLRATDATIAHHAEAIAAAAPCLESLDLAYGAAETDALQRASQFALVSLRLRNFGSREQVPEQMQRFDREMARLVDPASFPRLKHLGFKDATLHDAACQRFATAPWKLETLELHGNDLGQIDLQTLAHAPPLAQLEKFDADFIGRVDRAQIAIHSGFLHQVADLRLRTAIFGLDGTRKTLEAHPRNDLHTLKILPSMQVMDSVPIPLDTLRLRRLIYSTGLGREDRESPPQRLAELLAHPCLATLEQLKLHLDEIRSDQFRQIADAMPNLKHLTLWTHPEAAAALTALGESSLSRRLQSLELWNHNVDPAHLPELWSRSSWDELRVLSLGEGPWIKSLTADGMPRFGERLVGLAVSWDDWSSGEDWRRFFSSRFPALTMLALQLPSDIREAPLIADLLLRSSAFPNLVKMWLDGLDPAMADRLENAPWNTHRLQLSISGDGWSASTLNSIPRHRRPSLYPPFTSEGPPLLWAELEECISRRTMESSPGGIKLRG